MGLCLYMNIKLFSKHFLNSFSDSLYPQKILATSLSKVDFKEVYCPFHWCISIIKEKTEHTLTFSFSSPFVCILYSILVILPLMGHSQPFSLHSQYIWQQVNTSTYYMSTPNHLGPLRTKAYTINSARTVYIFTIPLHGEVSEQKIEILQKLFFKDYDCKLKCLWKDELVETIFIIFVPFFLTKYFAPLNFRQKPHNSTKQLIINWL